MQKLHLSAEGIAVLECHIFSEKVAYWSLRVLLNPSFSLIPYHTCIISHNINISYQIISSHLKSSSHNISSSQKQHSNSNSPHFFQQIPIGETYPSTFFFQIGVGVLGTRLSDKKPDPSRWVKTNHLAVSHPPWCFTSTLVKNPSTLFLPDGSNHPQTFSRWVTHPSTFSQGKSTLPPFFPAWHQKKSSQGLWPKL